jgi:hypothetical protein
MTEMTDVRAERVAARAAGLGIGLIVFMLTWTLGARITERFMDSPEHAYLAMGIALVAGAVSTVRAGHRLSAPHVRRS